MKKLTTDEKNFLRSQGISESDVFGSPNPTRREREDFDFVVYIGPECRKAGHRLRTRAGHCVQCDSRKLAYQRRFSQPGCLYVAGSQIMKYIKVGVTKSVDGREKSLRSERYAGAGDWRIIMFVEISDAGRLEDNIQKLLSHRRVFATYMKDSKSQKAKEVFSCQFSEVETAVKKVLVEHSMNLDGIQFSQDAKGYEFIV